MKGLRLGHRLGKREEGRKGMVQGFFPVILIGSICGRSLPGGTKPQV